MGEKTKGKDFVGAWKVPDNFGTMTRAEIDAWVDQMLPEIRAAFQEHAKEPEAPSKEAQ